MFYRLKTNTSLSQFLLHKSTYQNSTKTTQTEQIESDFQSPLRQLSLLGTSSYDRSLRRAFTRAKLLAFFNPDLTHFITLTYKTNQTDPQKTIQHIKDLIKQHNKKQTIQKIDLTFSLNQTNLSLKTATSPGSDGTPGLNSPTRGMKPSVQGLSGEPKTANKTKTPNPGNHSSDRTVAEAVKYIYVMELQKRGAVHVHMVANDAFEYVVNKNGHLSLKDWHHGFSSVLEIQNTNGNFKPYLYLFKYMHKAQRVGKSFIHVSKNFDKIKDIDYDDYKYLLTEEDLLYAEQNDFFIDQEKHSITKEYYRQSGQTYGQKEIQL